MICFFGGYFAAQRKQIFLLPEYIAFSEDKEAMLEDEFDSSVRALKIVGSGFRNLSHRDYLGSILALGIERSTIGDICLINDNSAIVFCCAEIEDFTCDFTADSDVFLSHRNEDFFAEEE